MPNISDINGVAIASLGDFNGVAKASITDINGVTIVVSGTNLLLDTYTGAAAAYSVRKLDKDYTGNCMRVRRDSDDSETDIGFDGSGDLSTSAIATHCGSANGYVVTWYDQANVSGTAANATQSLGSRQPQIYNGSAVITENGKPAVKSGANIGLEAQVAGELQGFSVSFLSTAKSVLFHRSPVIRTGDMWFLAAEQTSSTAIIDDEYSNIAIRKNGAAYSLTSKTRQNLYDDFSSQHLIHFDADMSTGSITQYFIGYNWPGTLWQYSMWSTQELILYPSTSSHSESGIEGNINAHFQIGNFGTPTSGLLSTYTGAAAAYSVRQLANTAALSMRVRRDNDDAEQDFGFDANGDLDTAAIATFVGSGNNGYVSKWYDQSGNGNDATQSTGGNQPQIYNGSAVITTNGKPALLYDGTNDAFADVTLGSAVNQNDIAMYGAAQWQSGGPSYAALINLRTSSDDGFGLAYRSDQGLYNDGGMGTHVSNDYTQRLWSGYADNASSEVKFFIDGSEIASTTPVSDTHSTLHVGGLGHIASSTRWTGYVQELITFGASTKANNSAIETDINNYFSIY